VKLGLPSGCEAPLPPSTQLVISLKLIQSPHFHIDTFEAKSAQKVKRPPGQSQLRHGALLLNGPSASILDN
jgi:hypothetical protein